MPECPCCGANAWKTHAYTAKASYLQCLGCHYFAQVGNAPDDKAARFEAEQEKFYDENSLFLAPNQSALNAEITRRRVSIVQEFLAPGASIVEVGPGAGDLLRAFAGLGYVTTAVEHSAALASRLRAGTTSTIIVGDFANQDLPRASFDAYCSFHVIEHVIDFKRHLAMARDCVKPGGYAFIATPNARGWEHRLPFALSPNYDSSHFQLFSAKALTPVLREAGWEVVSALTPSYAMAWLRVITKILRRVRGQDEDTTGGHYAKSTGGALRLAVSAFSTLTFPFRRAQELVAGGNELFIVARRSTG